MIELELVKAFHEKYNIPILSNSSDVPADRIALRITLLKEEIKELLEADNEGSIQEIAKESCDVLYVLLGTVLELGYYANFKNKKLFEKTPLQGTRVNCLTSIQTAFDTFKTDWSIPNLEKLLWAIEAYIETIGLKNAYFDVVKEVHRSNMSKGTNGKPIIRADGKIMKGEDFRLADLSFLTTPQ